MHHYLSLPQCHSRQPVSYRHQHEPLTSQIYPHVDLLIVMPDIIMQCQSLLWILVRRLYSWLFHNVFCQKENNIKTFIMFSVNLM